ncbi:MAG: CBS domain-containing protein [Candidatus Omnitrophica bacterium]|nr:CBS domain-containing protein [Candidatus Omnitrophota bacterium]
MTTVGQILKEKGFDVWSVNSTDTVFKALQLMAEKNVGALVVLNQGNLQGIFSERDYARAVAARREESNDTLVGGLMSKDVVCVDAGSTVEKCMQLMTSERIRHLPVMEGERIAGMISIGDVVNAIIGELKFSVKQMENYISGVS